MGDLNSTLQRRLPGEANVVGYFVAARMRQSSWDQTRSCYWRCVSAIRLSSGARFFKHSADEQVTFRSPGTSALGPSTVKNFALLDYTLVSSSDLHYLFDVRSSRTDPLASHHYVLFADVACGIVKHSPARRQNDTCSMDYNLLRSASVANAFARSFVTALPSKEHGADFNAVCAAVTGAFDKAARDVLIVKTPIRRWKPWITQATLTLIQRRRDARNVNDFEEEKTLNKSIRNSARKDRRTWLLDIAGSGSWDAMKKLRKPPRPKEGKLRGVDGIEVSSEERADTCKVS